MCVWRVPAEAKEGAGAPAAEGTGNFEHWHSCPVLNSGHLEEQQVPFSFRCNFKWDCSILILNYMLPVYRNYNQFLDNGHVLCNLAGSIYCWHL